MDTNMSSLSPPSIKLEVDEEDITSFEEKEKEDEVDLDLCFVCCSRVQVPRPHATPKTQPLTKNLRTIFLLRNLLQVPSSQLEENLKKCGNPENWISLCDPCTQLTNEALELHLKIGKIQKLVLEKTMSSSKKENWRRREVWTRTRSFVINHKPNTKSSTTTTPSHYTNSILESENLAESVGSPQNSIPDHDADDDLDDDDNDYQCLEERPMDDNTEQLNLKSENADTRAPPSRIKGHRYKSRGIRGIYKKSLRVDGKWKCHHCDELFTTRVACYQHEQQRHFTTPGQFVCDICGKHFNVRKNLNDHKRQVHKVKADGTPLILPEPDKNKVHICDSCGKTFKHPKCLRAHLRYTHLKKLNYGCPVCEKKFRSATDKNRHLFRNHKEDPATKQLIAEGFKDQIYKKQTNRKRIRVKKVKPENSILE